jgi:hypothetical protein
MKRQSKPKTAVEDKCPDCICQGAGPVLTEFLRNAGPSRQARKHFDQARVEFLKGLRSFLDERIEKMSAATETRGSKVTVE